MPKPSSGMEASAQSKKQATLNQKDDLPSLPTKSRLASKGEKQIHSSPSPVPPLAHESKSAHSHHLDSKHIQQSQPQPDARAHAHALANHHTPYKTHSKKPQAQAQASPPPRPTHSLLGPGSYSCVREHIAAGGSELHVRPGTSLWVRSVQGGWGYASLESGEAGWVNLAYFQHHPTTSSGSQQHTHPSPQQQQPQPQPQGVNDYFPSPPRPQQQHQQQHQQQQQAGYSPFTSPGHAHAQAHASWNHQRYPYPPPPLSRMVMMKAAGLAGRTKHLPSF